MHASSRRRFLANVGTGMLVASVGSVLAADLGLGTLYADEPAARLRFGELDPLVDLMQSTPAEKLLPRVVEKLKQGVELRTLVASAALANARAFGGHDYIGFHTFMALAPAYAMSRELPSEQQALPVLKVLYRNASRMQATGMSERDQLHHVDPGDQPASPAAGPGERMQQATRTADFDQAEKTFARLAQGTPGEAFNHLQFSVQDEVDVHRVVLAWRAWSTLDLTGEQHAHTLLRQSVRYCVNAETRIKNQGSYSPIRELLPKLLDQYKLLGSNSAGTRRADDGWIDRLATLIAEGSREQAADAVASALAEGFSPVDIGEALSLAANALVLRDPGRPQEWASAEKPAGSVHGDSVGVHASDAANAWRNIAAASNPRNAVASLIVGAFHTAGQSSRLNKSLYPLPEQLEKVTARDAEALLRDLGTAIESQDQLHATAVMQRYGELGHDPRGAFHVLLRYGMSEDGALHAEKYYHTVAEEFARTRPTFRWRQLAALARVTASEYGRPAPGYREACELLKVS
jgi:hypothetical protein